jgi:hypothetical protein
VFIFFAIFFHPYCQLPIETFAPLEFMSRVPRSMERNIQTL